VSSPPNRPIASTGIAENEGGNMTRSSMICNSMIRRKKNGLKKQGTVTLKTVAETVGLTPGTVSLVLNSAPGSMSIPQPTKDRIFAAARELNYQPNPVARALRTQTDPALTLGGKDVSDTSGTLMFVGAEHFLRALQAIREAGLRVPGDVSIVSFSQAQVATVAVAPPVSTSVSTMDRSNSAA
jgi:DNA-binding LacI/PurR family transcriptional regulator